MSLLGLRAHPGQSCGWRGGGRRVRLQEEEPAKLAQPFQVFCSPMPLGMARVRQGQKLSIYCTQPGEVSRRERGEAAVLIGPRGHGPGASWTRRGWGSEPGIWGTKGHNYKDDSAPLLQEFAIKQERWYPSAQPDPLQRICDLENSLSSQDLSLPHL